MPRMRELLSLRAVNSVKETLGAKIAASLTMRMPALSMVSGRNSRHADRELPRIFRFFLCGHGYGRHRDANELGRPDSGVAVGRFCPASDHGGQAKEHGKKHEHYNNRFIFFIWGYKRWTGRFRFRGSVAGPAIIFHSRLVIGAPQG